MTKMTSVPAEGTTCPRFLAFLDEITGGDGALAEFLQRMFGYCITGSTREHGLFFLYGTGANGKSVLLNTVAGIIGRRQSKPSPRQTSTGIQPSSPACRDAGLSLPPKRRRAEDGPSRASRL
jgi:hypothetical protein